MDNVQQIEWMNMAITIWVDHSRDIMRLKVSGYDESGNKRGCMITFYEGTIRQLPIVGGGQRYPAADITALFEQREEIDYVRELETKEETKDE